MLSEQWDIMVTGDILSTLWPKKSKTQKLHCKRLKKRIYKWCNNVRKIQETFLWAFKDKREKYKEKKSNVREWKIEVTEPRTRARIVCVALRCLVCTSFLHHLGNSFGLGHSVSSSENGTLVVPASCVLFYYYNTFTWFENITNN